MAGLWGLGQDSEQGQHPQDLGCTQPFCWGSPPFGVLQGSSSRAAREGVCTQHLLPLPCWQQLPWLVLVPVVCKSLLQTCSPMGIVGALAAPEGRLERMAAAGTPQNRLNPKSAATWAETLRKHR